MLYHFDCIIIIIFITRNYRIIVIIIFCHNFLD